MSRSVLLVIFALTLATSACAASNNRDNTSPATPSATSTEAAQPSTEQAPQVGVRENPVAFGQQHAIANNAWKVRVIDATPDAWQRIHQENQFNDPPKDGYQFFLARVAVQYVGRDHENTAAVELEALGPLGVTYNRFSDSCGVVPDDMTTKDLYTGGELEGNVCWSIKRDDASALLLSASTGRIDEERTFFGLHEGS